MDSKNTLTLDYASNPDVRNIFTNYRIGDKCELLVLLQLNRKDEQSIEGTILKIASPEEEHEKYFSDEDDDGGTGPDNVDKKVPTFEAPIMMAMKAGPSEGMSPPLP